MVGGGTCRPALYYLTFFFHHADVVLCESFGLGEGPGGFFSVLERWSGLLVYVMICGQRWMRRVGSDIIDAGTGGGGVEGEYLGGVWLSCWVMGGCLCR